MAHLNLMRKVLVTRVEHLHALYTASGEISHRGEKGLLRELFLRRVIDAVLPKHFAVGSGIIVDRWGRQSPQVDLLVFDTRLVPPVLHEDSHGIYPIDSVMRVIEVKSVLNTSAFSQFGDLAFSIHPQNPKGLKLAHPGNLSGGKSYYPLPSLFAYRSDLSNLELPDHTVFRDLNAEAVICAAQKHQCFCSGKGVKTFENLPDAVIYFMAWMLNAIEVTAGSRQPYQLVEWLEGL